MLKIYQTILWKASKCYSFFKTKKKLLLIFFKKTDRKHLLAYLRNCNLQDVPQCATIVLSAQKADQVSVNSTWERKRKRKLLSFREVTYITNQGNIFLQRSMVEFKPYIWVGEIKSGNTTKGTSWRMKYSWDYP